MYWHRNRRKVPENSQKQVGHLCARFGREKWIRIKILMLPFITISAAMTKLPFHGCEKNYIRETCKGICCHSSVSPSGIIVSVLPEEEKVLTEQGAEIVNGQIQAVDKRCPFKLKGSELCALHDKGLKPFGCRVSPFSLNKTGTLIIRNRYRLMRCYNAGPKIPAYIAFAQSLITLIGGRHYGILKMYLDNGGGNMMFTVSKELINKLRLNETLKEVK
jgi:hypothetical protein